MDNPQYTIVLTTDRGEISMKVPWNDFTYLHAIELRVDSVEFVGPLMRIPFRMDDHFYVRLGYPSMGVEPFPDDYT